MRKMRKYRDYLIETLQDPEEATAYLQVALEEYQADHDTAALLIALRSVAEAQGGLSELARRTRLNRQNLYRTLSSNGNPKLNTLGAILNGLGYRLSVEPLEGEMTS
ncbi:putative addiction module antidote protein [Candidatus Poribacteria bacterium]|nr:putative addiction module antidote protein [Candidatus Poribacteria bacterium]